MSLPTHPTHGHKPMQAVQATPASFLDDLRQRRLAACSTDAVDAWNGYLAGNLNLCRTELANLAKMARNDATGARTLIARTSPGVLSDLTRSLGTSTEST